MKFITRTTQLKIDFSKIKLSAVSNIELRVKLCKNSCENLEMLRVAYAEATKKPAVL